EYVDDTAASPFLASVTLRRKVGAGSWNNVTNAAYAYHDGGDSFGSGGDLKTVTTQTWDGAAWQDTGTTFYRYYLALGSSSSSSSSSSSGSSGPVSLLKYVVLP